MARDPIAELQKCKSISDQSVCVGKVLLDYLKNEALAPAGGNIYCRCFGSGVGGNGKVRLQRVVPDELPMIIAEDLNPADCVMAMRFHPCTGDATPVE